MQLPANPLKRALQDGRPQIGLWSMLASPIATEVIAGSGFDFLVLDMEHAPNELAAIGHQLQAMHGGASAAVVRPPWNDTVAFKRLLDLGAQNFLVPVVQDAGEARRAVAATRYPPHGVRGVASATRANRFGRVSDYWQRANDEICVHVQIETRVAVANIEAIAAVDGIDGLFIGPNDLAADLGQLGNSTHPDVRRAIDDAIARIRHTGKAAGILTSVETDAHHWLELGATFVAVGSDLGVLARQTEALARTFKGRP